jgi:hypothetical protein
MMWFKRKKVEVEVDPNIEWLKINKVEDFPEIDPRMTFVTFGHLMKILYDDNRKLNAEMKSALEKQ